MILDLAPAPQPLLDEVRDLGEVDADVGLGHVQQLETLVLDVEWFVELLVGVHGATGLTFGCVQDMRHSNLLQVECVSRCRPETQ